MASRKKNFFYIILTTHYFKVGDEFKKRLGFGVTGNSGRRIRSYSNTSGGEQEFLKVYYSPNYEVMEIETILKQRLGDDLLTINGNEVEWISPYSDIDTDELINMVDKIISDLRLNVRSIKSDYLPFKDAEWQKDINEESIRLYPDMYLEDI